MLGFGTWFCLSGVLAVVCLPHSPDVNQAGYAGAGAVSGFFSDIGLFDVFGIDRRFGTVAAQVGEFPGTFGEKVE